MSEVLMYTVEENKVFLNETKWFPKREIANVSDPSKLQHTIGFLTDKFSELNDEVTLLLADYSKEENKLKLAGKLSRTKQMLITSKAIGDFATLLEPIEVREREIQSIVEANIEQRNNLLLEAEQAVKDAPTNWKASTEKITNISKQLRELPLVPDTRVEEIKNKFEKLKDEFFARKQSFFDESDKILLDNLAHKMELCEKAEALQHSTEWKKTTEEIQKLNETWKSIGPIPRHRSDELWLRFNAAKDVFFAAKKQHYENVKNEQEKNLELKLELIAQAEALSDSRDWKKTTDAYNKLFEEWKKIGRVSEEKSDEVWKKFNDARDVFFKARDAYYESIRFNLEDNFTRKMAIVTRTEEIANNPVIDWDGATEEILEMTDDWKKIGRVPKEHGDMPWERFLAAKKKFFDAKDAERARRRSEGSKVLDDKLRRNRSYYNKLSRELELEKEVLWDFEDRLKNLPPGIRTFETKERYENIIEDARKKVEFLTKKLKDLKATMDADEKEFRFLTRPFKKKVDQKAEKTDENNSAAASSDSHAQADDVEAQPASTEEQALEPTNNTEDQNEPTLVNADEQAAVIEKQQTETAETDASQNETTADNQDASTEISN